MPLLNKKPLELHKYDGELRDDAEVFYCKCTNEIFEDYEEYCQRIISCNSLIWSCAVTGKSNLTYEEALASEENALKSVKDFPLELRAPVLYLASRTNRTHFHDFIDDVFNFVKDHYFLGESVEACFDGQWVFGHILQISLPTKQEVDEYCKKNNITGPVSSRPYPGCLYKYEVEELDDDNEDGSDVTEIRVVTGDKIRRVKGVFTKDKNKIFLKHFAELKKNGIYGLKKNIIDKYGITTTSFSHIFVGEPPVFENRKSNNGLKMAQQSIKKFLKPEKSNKPNENAKKLSPGKKTDNRKVIEAANKIQKKYQEALNKTALQAKKEALKQKALEDKNKKLEELRLKKEKEKVEKAKLADFVKEWQRKREDLECEDLKDFPPANPVNCRIPNEYFGDFIMILEFFNNFKDVLKIKEYFPFGLKFDLVERALVDMEIAGPFCDILQLLLTSLFGLQEQEDDEMKSTAGANNVLDLETDESGDISTDEAVRLATIAANWTKMHHGTPLDKLSLDAITVSEILRLHLLASGGRSGEKSSKWRYQERGGYTPTDDPGLMFRLNEPHILKFLAVKSVAELPVGDKLKIMTCLMNQMLTYAGVRDIIDERFEKVKTGKNELKNDQIAETKKEREALAQKSLKKKEAKEKGETIPEETEEEKLKTEKETSKKKAEFHKRHIQLQKDAMECQVLPLGMDRGYRRFWVFTSLPGLFVEDDEQWPGTCLPQPTPNNRYLLNTEEDTMSYVRRLFEEERNCGSDKENEGDSSHPIQSPKKKLLGESNGVSVSLSPKINNNRSFKEEEEKPRSLVCTANEESCYVHNRTKSRTKWLFYYKESDIDELINCLNKRGYREHRLRKLLIEEKDRIVPRLGQCPVNLLNPLLETNVAPVQNVTKFTRSQRFYENANLKYPPGTPIQEILELYIRELILDTEEKIYCGGLGTLKVKNRLAWRDAIEARGYDKQDDELTWMNCTIKKDKTIEKIKEEDTSRPETPCSIDSNTDHDILTNKSDQNQTVRDLASAVLQIARSIEPKYLQKPLTHEKKRDKSMMDKWESSLMCSTSFAQVYLHIATLENSIQWNKSALNARCKVCRKGGDGENMLLCDGCDRGFHLYCLKPKLTSIPKGDWFCLACKPREKVERTAKRSRRLFSEDSDNDEPLITLRNKRSKGDDNPNKRKLRGYEEDEDDDSSDEPLSKIAKRRSRKSDAE